MMSTLRAYLDTHRPDWRDESDADVLAWLNGPSGQYRETMITERQLYARLGPAEAEAILQALEQVAASAHPAALVVKRALKWLEPSQGGLDLGMAATRGMVVQLQQGGALTETQAEALLGLAGDSPTHWTMAGQRESEDEPTRLQMIQEARHV